jgi:hypothetical protein
MLHLGPHLLPPTAVTELAIETITQLNPQHFICKKMRDGAGEI